MRRRGPLSLPIFLLFTIGGDLSAHLHDEQDRGRGGHAAGRLHLLADPRRRSPVADSRRLAACPAQAGGPAPQGLFRARAVRHRRAGRADDLARAEAADGHPLDGGDSLAADHLSDRADASAGAATRAQPDRRVVRSGRHPAHDDPRNFAARARYGRLVPARPVGARLIRADKQPRGPDRPAGDAGADVCERYRGGGPRSCWHR